MKINDAHCHFGLESFGGTIGRRKAVSNLNFRKLKHNLKEYEIEHVVLFAQPRPTSTYQFLSDLLSFLINNRLDVNEDYKLRRKVDYSETNDLISKLRDSRIEFVPFISSSTPPEYLDKFNNIKGVKFYEPNGELSPKLLDYLNERELNLIIHKNPQNEGLTEYFLNYVNFNPGINFQVAHYAQCMPGIIRALDEYDNLYIDTSGSTDSLYRLWGLQFEPIAREYSHKIIFGSDEPWSNTGKEIEMVKSFYLDKKQEENIFYRNYFKIWK